MKIEYHSGPAHGRVNTNQQFNGLIIGRAYGS